MPRYGHLPPSLPLSLPFCQESLRGATPKRWLAAEMTALSRAPSFADKSRPLPFPVEQAGWSPHVLLQSCQLLLPAGLLQGAHPLLVELCLEELGGDLAEEVLQRQGLRVSLGPPPPGTQAASPALRPTSRRLGFGSCSRRCPSAPTEPGAAGLQVSRVHLQDDGQHVRRLAVEADLRSAVEGLPELPGGPLAGRQPEDPLRGWPVLVQQSQQVLQGTEEESCLAGDRPWGRRTFLRGRSRCGRLHSSHWGGAGWRGGWRWATWGGDGFVPEPHPGSLCWGHHLSGGAGGVGTPCPGLLTWMGWGSVPSWLRRAARGRPKRAPPPPEPDGPGTSAAAEVPRRAKGQGRPILLLRVPPAAEENRAKNAAWRGVPWERGAPGAQLSPAAERRGRTRPAGRAAAAPVQHECPPAGGGEEGRPAPVFSELTSHVATSTLSSRGDGRQPPLRTSLQDTRRARRAAPLQKGPPASCIGPWPCARGGEGCDCTPSDPHLCLALDQPLQAAGA